MKNNMNNCETCNNCMWARTTEKIIRCLPNHLKECNADSKCILYVHNPDTIQEATEEELDDGWKNVRTQAILKYGDKLFEHYE